MEWVGAMKQKPQIVSYGSFPGLPWVKLGLFASLRSRKSQLNLFVLCNIVVQNSATSPSLSPKNRMISATEYATHVISAKAEIQDAAVMDCRLRGNDGGFSAFRKSIFYSND